MANVPGRPNARLRSGISPGRRGAGPGHGSKRANRRGELQGAGNGRAPAALNGKGVALDELDRQIISILQEDGRAAFTAIAERLSVAEGTIRNRVSHLLASKVLQIIGVANPLALGYDAYAMIGLKVLPGHDPEEAAAYFRDRAEVTYVAFVAGRYDMLVEVICETHDQLANFLREHCYGRPDISSVEPMVCLAMYKNMFKWGSP